jgi:dihydroxyacid dehydratase/phosphogluconate dehydratase
MPKGLLKNGEHIRLSVKERSIALLVDEVEPKIRVAAAKPLTETPSFRIAAKRRVRNPYPQRRGYGFRAPRFARPRNDG